MLLHTKNRVVDSAERAVASGTTITAEGCALVADYTDGVFGVKPSTSSAAPFVGVARAQQLTPLLASKVERFTVGASKVVTLSKIPTAYTSLRIYDVTADADLAVDSTGPASSILAVLTAATATVTTHSTQVGHELEFSYRYVPSAQDALDLQGNIPAGGAASLILDSVEVIEIGDVYTSEYDPTADYTDTSKSVCIMAGGLFTNVTPDGTHAAVRAVIIEVPSADSAWLGLRLLAA